MSNLKKMVAVLLVIVMAVSIMPIMEAVQVDAEEILTEGDYEYYIQDDGTVEIRKYLGSDKVVTVPSIIGGASVSVIGFVAFANNSQISSVTLPEGLREIGELAFDASGIEEIYIPDSVEKIGNRAFAFCQNLKHITLPKSLTKIDNYLLWYCTNLESVDIPYGVTEIGIAAFCSCENLKCVELPDGVETIKVGSFSLCKKLEYIKIPESVTLIESGVFSECESLTSIELPSQINEIATNLFSGCTSLSLVDIKGNIISINNGAFRTCISLKKMNVPNSTRTIGESAFDSCNSLQSINIPSSVSEIGGSAFYNCDSLTEVYIPSSVTYIGTSPFGDCDKLKNIEVSSSNPNYYSYKGDLYEYGNSSAGTYSRNARNTTITSTNTGDKCVQYATGKTEKTYAVPDNVTIIGAGAFRGCKSVENIDKMENVNTIEDYAFYQNPKIKELKIPEFVNSIGTNVVNSNVVIYGRRDTPAYEYAENLGLEFVEIGVEKMVPPVTELSHECIVFYTFDENEYTSWEVFGADGEKSAGLLNVVVDYGNNSVYLDNNRLAIKYDDIAQGIVFNRIGYQSYIVPQEIVESWRSVELGKQDIYLPENETGDSCYISSIYGRNSGKGERYIDIKREKLKLLKSTKQDIIMTSVGMEEGDVYCLMQDGSRMLTSTDGRFLDVELHEEFTSAKKTYAYIKKANGEITDPIELEIEKHDLSIAELKLLKMESFNMFGPGSSFTIGDRVPLIGGTEIEMEGLTMPIGLSVTEGKIRMSIGADIFSEEDKLFEEFKWKEFKESFNIIDEIEDEVEDAQEVLDAFKAIQTQNGINYTKTPECEYSLYGMGYVEAMFTEDGIIVTDVGGHVLAEFIFEHVWQVAIGYVPVYGLVEASAEGCFKIGGVRVVPDTDVPLQFDVYVEMEPALKLGAGLGVKNAVSGGIYGKGSMFFGLDIDDLEALVKLTGDFGIEGDFFGIEGKHSLADGEYELFDGPLFNDMVSTYSANLVNNADIFEKLNKTTTYSSISREYLKYTSEWLGSSNVNCTSLDVGEIQNVGETVINSTNVENNGAVTISDLQNSIYKNTQTQIVSIGNDMLIAWIQDDGSRDDYNRMRLVYSVYDSETKTFSAPKAVYDDGTLDGSPSLASDGENVYIAWQNIDTLITAADENAINEIIKNSEIMVAKYDAVNDEFTGVISLTDDEEYDYATI